MLRNLVSVRNLLLISLGLLVLAVMTIVLAPKGAKAEGGVPFVGTFTAAASVTPNADNVTYCGGPVLDLAVEAHGTGYSTLGALSFSLQKTIDSSKPAMHGCLVLTAPNGDTLNATYDGTEDPSNSNNFNTGSGSLTITGGTGRFRDARGSAHFTAVFSGTYPASSFIGGTGAPFQVMAFYSVEGTVSLQDGDR
jgi:threonine dehydrogenase-like Zn-dependent dehydrogenase